MSALRSQSGSESLSSQYVQYHPSSSGFRTTQRLITNEPRPSAYNWRLPTAAVSPPPSSTLRTKDRTSSKGTLSCWVSYAPVGFLWQPTAGSVVTRTSGRARVIWRSSGGVVMTGTRISATSSSFRLPCIGSICFALLHVQNNNEVNNWDFD